MPPNPDRRLRPATGRAADILHGEGPIVDGRLAEPADEAADVPRI
jgi:hypothetical protein